MKSNSKPIVIIVLMAVLLFLIILNILMNKKKMAQLRTFSNYKTGRWF